MVSPFLSSRYFSIVHSNSMLSNLQYYFPTILFYDFFKKKLLFLLVFFSGYERLYVKQNQMGK